MYTRLAAGPALAALLVAWLGCGPSSPPKYVINPATGMAPVTWGMTAAQVQAALGPAEAIKPQSRGRVLLLSYLSKGFTLDVDQSRGLIGITCSSWDIGIAFSRNAEGFGGKTAEGVALGATEEAITAAYGKPDQRTTNEHGVVTLVYGRFEKVFYLKSGWLSGNRLWQFTIAHVQPRPTRPAAARVDSSG